MKNKALRLLDSLVTDETTKAELDIINYIKRLVRADHGVKTTNENEQYIKELFDKFYAVYCRKGGKEQAYKTWKKKLSKIKTQDEILTKARKIAKLYQHYANEWTENKTEQRYIPLCSSWLNANIPD
jgi:hypothetical protein